MTADNVIDFVIKPETKDDSDYTVIRLYEVHDPNDDKVYNPVLMGHVVEKDQFLCIQYREPTPDDIEHGIKPDKDGLIPQSILFTRDQLAFINAYAVTFSLIEDTYDNTE